jgi:hypothetical protein
MKMTVEFETLRFADKKGGYEDVLVVHCWVKGLNEKETKKALKMRSKQIKKSLPKNVKLIVVPAI